MARWAFFIKNKFENDAYNFDSACEIYAELRKYISVDDILITCDGHTDYYPKNRYDEIFKLSNKQVKK